MIHIFDIDYTVIKRSSAWYFLIEAMRTGVVRFAQVRQLPFDWIKYKLGRPNMDFIEDAVKHLAGIDQGVLEQTVQSCFERRMKSGIYQGTAQLITDALARGERVIFATSSLDAMVRPLERFFGLETSIATKLEWREGKTTGGITGCSLFGREKKGAVEAWLTQNGLDPADVCFYSDSYTDIPLLEICGKSVAVNPDHILARRAKKCQWEIRRFSRTLGK